VAVLTIVDDERALAATAAERITALIEGSIRERASAFVSLTGGSTPRTLYRFLGDPTQSWRPRIEWSRVHLFWGDERHVPPDHPESNFGMANEALVSHIPIRASQVHRMRGELPDAKDAAREYDAELDAAFSAAERPDHTFDIMLLGLGEDAHIASIFPGSPLFRGPQGSAPHPNEDRRSATGEGSSSSGANLYGPRPLVAAVWAAHLNAWRITLTPATILNSRSILMIVAGAAKADAVWWSLEGSEQVDRHPAQLLRRARDRVEWIIDRPAAGRLHDAPHA
jgi:6-phosphogluconolactonase